MLNRKKNWTVKKNYFRLAQNVTLFELRIEATKNLTNVAIFIASKKNILILGLSVISIILRWFGPIHPG